MGGVLGAVILPALSDRLHKRKIFLLIAVIGAIPGLFGLTYAATLPLLLVSVFVLGFFLVSALPVGFQYSAEITQPTPEGTSNGLIQLFGQAAVVFVYVMEAIRAADGSFTPSLLLALGLLVLSILLVLPMKEVSPAS